MSLADRLKKVQQSQQQSEKKVALEKMSFDELQNRTIQFGQKKVGQPYHQVMHEDPGYVTWFVQTYKDSQKDSHLEFLAYVEQYTERMEAKIGRENGNPYPIPPKNKKTQGKVPEEASASNPKVNPGTEMSKMHEDEDSDWDAVTSVMDIRAENVVIQERLSQMENVMQHMMQTLLQIQQQQSQSKVWTTRADHWLGVWHVCPSKCLLLHHPKPIG